MNFTMLARFVAYLLLIFGSFRIALAIGFRDQPAAIARYIGPNANIGEAIDQAALVVFIGLALGTLTEISISLKKILKIDREEVE